jgi:hypothetical protein
MFIGQSYFDLSKMSIEDIFEQLRDVNLDRDSKRINLAAYYQKSDGDFWTESKALSWKESNWAVLSVKKYQLCKELVDRGLETYEAVFEEIQGEIDVLLGLTDSKMVEFAEIHKKHVEAWESVERIKQHSLSNIQKVKWVPEEDCFHVFYKETDCYSPTWYHYGLDGCWY